MCQLLRWFSGPAAGPLMPSVALDISSLCPSKFPLLHSTGAGSLFASAFSPRPRGLRQAPSLPTPPLAPPRPAARLGSRSASSGGALGGSASVYSEVDRLLDTMF